MNKIEIEIDPKGYVRRTRKGKFSPAAKKYHSYLNKLRWIAKEQGFELSNQFSITFYIPVPPSITKKEKARRLGQPHQFKPDLDNLIKATKDALLKEDSTVWKYGEMKKIWSENGKIVIENIV